MGCSTGHVFQVLHSRPATRTCPRGGIRFDRGPLPAIITVTEVAVQPTLPALPTGIVLQVELQVGWTIQLPLISLATTLQRQPRKAERRDPAVDAYAIYRLRLASFDKRRSPE